MREALQFSESATEMNSHHLDCTITGGRGRHGEGREGEGGRTEGFPGFLHSQESWKWNSLCLILKCFIMVMMGSIQGSCCNRISEGSPVVDRMSNTEKLLDAQIPVLHWASEELGEDGRYWGLFDEHFETRILCWKRVDCSLGSQKSSCTKMRI